MAKTSPVSIKYMVKVNFTAEGALEKPDVIGAIFGQTEGLRGSDLEMRELQKEGKIGRIEVHLERDGSKTKGIIEIPTALDQSETTLIAAAIETIDRIGPSDAQMEVEKIEDVRGNKRDYIIERAKKLMKSIEGSTDSREISKEITESRKTSKIQEYGDEKVPCGDISGKEIVVVEGRADVLNLMRAGVDNVIAMNGTKLPKSVQELTKGKIVTLFVDGDRGGQLIIQNVTDNAEVDSIAVAPDGKEVEELTEKEVLMNLRKKVSAEEYLGKRGKPFNKESSEKKELNSGDKEVLKKISEGNQGSGKAILLDSGLKEIKSVSAKTLGANLKKINDKPHAIVIDGTVTPPMIRAAEDSGCEIIAAKNFSTADTSITLLSL